MDRQGTWEILLLPVGKDAGKGMASVNNSDPGPLSSLRGGGSAMSGHKPGRHPAEPVGESISRRPCGSRKS